MISPRDKQGEEALIMMADKFNRSARFEKAVVYRNKQGRLVLRVGNRNDHKRREAG